MQVCADALQFCVPFFCTISLNIARTSVFHFFPYHTSVVVSLYITSEGELLTNTGISINHCLIWTLVCTKNHVQFIQVLTGW